MAQPMWRSISTIFSTDEVSRRVDVTRFSTPRITPSPVATCYTYKLLVRGNVDERVDRRLNRVGRTPIAVEPSLMASNEYSTWKRRPSGEKVLASCELGRYERDMAGQRT